IQHLSLIQCCCYYSNFKLIVPKLTDKMTKSAKVFNCKLRRNLPL
uniref:Uncharacterized protein n=1 Tax=Ciona intestinalis TaxID=7719 RepID=H2Y2S7_CIOIN